MNGEKILIWSGVIALVVYLLWHTNQAQSSVPAGATGLTSQQGQSPLGSTPGESVEPIGPIIPMPTPIEVSGGSITIPVPGGQHGSGPGAAQGARRK